MEKEGLLKIIENLGEISEKYDIKNLDLKELKCDIENFRVTTPIIGGFSSGKSSLINAMIDENILATSIEPETSIPTEIYYGDDNVSIIDKDNISRNVSIKNLKDNEFNIKSTKLIKVEKNNDFLKSIPNVKIVDMPGFDSGIESHNKAIDMYISNSLAYIITFEVGEGIRESIAEFLMELKLHKLPILVVITKCDKATSKDIEETVEYMKQNISKYIDNKKVDIVCSKSKKDKEVEQIKLFLLEIEKQSNSIMNQKYKSIITSRANTLTKYLNSRINNKSLPKEELLQKEKSLNDELENLNLKLEKEQEKFSRQIQNSIGIIKSNIQSSLVNSRTVLENMLFNGQDITSKINLIVRNSVTSTIQREFEPKLKKYLKNISDMINIGEDLDSGVEVDEFSVKIDDILKDTIKKAIPAALAVIGGILAGPIGAVIAGVLGVVVDAIFSTKQKEDKRRSISKKVNDEIIPQVSQEASHKVEEVLLSYISEINEEIRVVIQREKDIKVKALEDIRKQREIENEKQNEEINNLKIDLDKVGEIVNGIQ